MINPGSTELKEKWIGVLHNESEDYIVPESNVNVMCPYDCIDMSDNTYTTVGYCDSAYCDISKFANTPTTINRNKKVATFEWNFWVLDGSFEVLDTGEKFNGFISRNLSTEDCDFTGDVTPYVQMNKSSGAFSLNKNQTIMFDSLTNNCPAQLNITTSYVSSGSRVTTNNIDFNIEEMLTNEELTEYVALFNNNISTTQNNTQLLITFSKTLMPYRRIRVGEYNNGFKFFKDKKDLMSFVHTRSVALAMDELPQNDLQISFSDLLGIYDNKRTDSPFKVAFNNTHRFFVYYGYNFDDIGWNYVQADVLCINELELNRDSMETILNLQSTLQLYNTKYDANNLDTVMYVDGRYIHTKTGVWAWTTFRDFMDAVGWILDINAITYEGSIAYLDTVMETWQNFLRQTTTADSSSAFTKLPLKEVMQQICAFLRCALVRQVGGGFIVKSLTEQNIIIEDTIEAMNVFSYPTKIIGEEYKYVTITTPRIYNGQSDDEETSAQIPNVGTRRFLPVSKKFTISSVSGTNEATINENIIPLNYASYERPDCWLWGAGLWQNYANHYAKVKKATRYEFGEVLLNPLLQVADWIRINLGENYEQHIGLIEKIEVNYDGSFKGAITLCSFYD